MYIKEAKTVNKKTGKIYTAHKLVESHLTDKGPRQRLIMHLGKLSVPRSKWRLLASILEKKLAGQEELFNDPELEDIADEAIENYDHYLQESKEKKERKEKANLVSVDLESTAILQSRSLGAELIAHAFWQRLSFGQLLSDCGMSEREISLSKAVILGRLIEPGSDISTWQWLRKRTSLLEFLPAELGHVGKDALYEIADLLLLHKEKIENGLYKSQRDLFSLDTTLFLYDLTNTYFEGQSLKNDLSHHGRSKEKRNDCPLVTLALVVDQHGFPVMSRIYKGNQSEPKTLEDILSKLYDGKELSLFTDKMPSIVMDRGIATKDNIALLKKNKYPYVIIERRNVAGEYEKEFKEAQKKFEKLKDSDEKIVYVQKIEIEDGTRVLALSERKEKKESAINDNKEKRFLEDIKRLTASNKKGNIKLSDKVYERIGRIKERYPSIAKYYTINTELDKDKKQVIKITWNKKKQRKKENSLAGCYVIETSHKNLSAEEIWHLYMTLNRVENAFRSLKTNLGTRPIYHQTALRTEAHLFLSVVAYYILISLEHTLRNKGDSRSWESIKKQVKTHQLSKVALTDENGHIYHLRISGTPEDVHRNIYSLLEVKNPLKRKKYLIARRL